MTRDRFFAETPFFTEEHVPLAEGVADFVAREIEPRADGEGRDEDEHFREMLDLLAQSGLLGYAVAASGGDEAQPLTARALPCPRGARVLLRAGRPRLRDAGARYIRRQLGAPEHVREFWLERARSGKSVAAFALTEPEAGSDVSSIQTTARRDGDAYVIDGHKCFISNAGVADFYTVFARTGTREDGRAELSAFIVGARMPGFRVRARMRLIAPHPIGEIEFENLRVPAENLVGAEGDGFRLAMRTMDTFRASVGAAACGMARRALDESIAYAKGRKQFGVPLAMHQLIQEKLAVMQTELDAARLLVYRAASLRDTGAHGPSLTRAASEAKLYATEAAGRIIDEAVQIHGGQGLVRGSVVERLYRDVRALRIYEGTSEIQKLVIARELLRND